MLHKIFAIMLSLMLAAFLTACQANNTANNALHASDDPFANDTASSSQEELVGNAPGNPGSVSLSGQRTMEQPTKIQAREHNAQIDQDTINLIQFKTPTKGDTVVVFETTAGTMKFHLFPTEAPMAVENFIYHAENDYYKDMSFYRVMENFYIESGAPTDTLPTSIYTNNEGTPIPFVTETSLNLWNFRGALVMKNKGLDRPHSNTSEFRILQAETIAEDWFVEMEDINYPATVVEAYKEHGGIPGFDSRVTVFGQIYEGIEVLDTIARAKTEAPYTPTAPIIINKIIVGTYGENGEVVPTEVTLGDSQG